MRNVIPLFLALSLQAQNGPNKWYEFHGQATTITATQGEFDSQYEGPLSLRPIRETDTSLTITLVMPGAFAGSSRCRQTSSTR
jgi:hypothetical protein